MRGPRKNSPGLKLWWERAAGGGGGRSGNNRERPPFLFPPLYPHPLLSLFFLYRFLFALSRLRACPQATIVLETYFKDKYPCSVVLFFSSLSGGALE